MYLVLMYCKDFYDFMPLMIGKDKFIQTVYESERFVVVITSR